MKSLIEKIRTVPNFPKDGIMFRDITTLLIDADGFKTAIDKTVKRWSDLGVTKIAGIDARGFILGGAIAYNLGVGFLPVRKKGKLPPKTIGEEYQLEYGVDTLEVLQNSLDSSDRVVVVDDLIATGGTAEATVKLIRRLKAEVLGCSFIINLPDLGGVSRLKELGVESFSLCEFKGH